ncbi:hypothetical protein [Shewanella sp. Isolate7]|uniref:hypothetical protein n=1 Tax=Shewanella sp. Isolate7 TaxID=2908528 RepID=UPI001EFD0A5F|nr:hypothetical protein [Shewanella sp. Isolate7]MCG9720387.1 hypothetical protein [Shewanella sp. Isolate7]
MLKNLFSPVFALTLLLTSIGVSAHCVSIGSGGGGGEICCSSTGGVLACEEK